MACGYNPCTGTATEHMADGTLPFTGGGLPPVLLVVAVAVILLGLTLWLVARANAKEARQR